MMKTFKRTLALCLIAALLCCCAAGITFSAAAQDPQPLPISLDYSVKQVTTLNNDTSASLVSVGGTWDPIDLTQYGYTTKTAGELAIQIDVFFYTDNATLANKLENGGHGGQTEITSGAFCDKEELAKATSFPWKNGEWTRVVMPLDKFTTSTGGAFRPENWNFFRIYINGISGCNGATCMVKFVNAQLIYTEDADIDGEVTPIGDGSFLPDAPTWQAFTSSDEVTVAGYSLGDYVSDSVTDYANVIQSLLDGMQRAGGGAVYIPAGVWPCYSEITVPTGCTLCGDWSAPDGKSPIGGTILAYYGKSAKDGNSTPFVTLAQSSSVQNMAFWYPEQSEKALINYPATIQVGQSGTTWAGAENITLINSWIGITAAEGAACPNMFGIYGTPIYEGIHVSSVQDIMRTEEIHFSPDYWLNSGHFTGDEDTLRNRVHQMGRALWFGRTDWSYLTDVYVDGYRTGVEYDSTAAYGQTFNLNFSNCSYAVIGTLTASVGEQMTNLTITDCDWGIYTASNTSSAVFLLQNADIRANTAIDIDSNNAKISVVNSTVCGGISANAGCLIVSNTDFADDEPAVTMGKLARVIFTGNRGLKLSDIDNPGSENLTFKKAAIDTVEIDLTDELQAAARRQNRLVKNQTVTVATGLDALGKTDNSAALQAQLDALADKGGILFIPGGHYRLEHGVTVPQGVELRGVCDFAQMPYNTGTILDVICRDEPAVTLAPNDGGEDTCSGVRAITFYYPEQIPEEFYQNDPIGPTPYDYSVYAKDADFAYAVNVALTNAYDAVCFDGCDDHFIDGLVGFCDHDGVVTKNSARGIVRDVQFNGHTVCWGSLGWPSEIRVHNDSDTSTAPRHPYDGGDSQTGATEFTSFQFHYEFQQKQSEKFVLENTTDEMVFGCFTYGGATTLKVTGNDTTATVIGTAGDYVSRFADIEGGRQIDLINSQMTPFVYRNYTITRMPDIYGVRLGSGFTGTVNMLGAEVWERCEAAFKVEGGTLNATSLIVTSGDGGNNDTWVSVPEIVIADVADTAQAHITDMFQTCKNVQIGRADTIESSFCAAVHNGAVNSRSYTLPDGEAEVDAAATGDVNGDEKIDSTDARLILQYYAKKIDEQGLNTAEADVNGDGKIDSTDARLILQLYAKKIDEFPEA